MKDVTCSRLGVVLHIEIQKRKKDMKTSEFQKYLGGTPACMKRPVMATKGCCRLTSKDTYFSDIWFSSVKTAEEAMAAGVDYCRPIEDKIQGFLSS